MNDINLLTKKWKRIGDSNTKIKNMNSKYWMEFGIGKRAMLLMESVKS